jgi:hypothetical protein
MATRMPLPFTIEGRGNEEIPAGSPLRAAPTPPQSGFAAVAILTLALGIGANTAIFSVLDSILLQPLPFPHADRLAQIDPQTDYLSFPKGWIREYQRRAATFASVCGHTLNTEYNVTGGGTSDRAFGSTVSTNLFDTLSVRPSWGRFFSALEGKSGQDRASLEPMEVLRTE